MLADHARATAFLIADGVLPSNEGRGYVLRRIMRRAIRYGRKLSLEASLLPTATEELIALMKGSYPELSQQKQVILNTVREEERRFLKTLDQGTEILQAEFQRLEKKSQQIVSGEFAFKLYDTYGFPIDLTRIMASEQNFKVNEEEFDKQIKKEREKTKNPWKGAGP